LEETMKQYNIKIDPPPFSKGHTLYVFAYNFNVKNSYVDEWILDSRANHQMEKCKATFFAPDGCNNRHIYVGDNMYF
jgi:hypothetical protein